MIVSLTRSNALAVISGLEATERREWEALLGPLDPDGWADQHARCPGPAYVCLTDDGTPLAMGGFNLSLPGVAIGWLGVTDRFPERAVEITRACRKAIDFALEHGLAEVVLVLSAAFHHGAHRWFRTLGLERGATLPGLGRNGEDFIIYQRTNLKENDLCAEAEEEAATTAPANANGNGRSMTPFDR